AINNALSSPLLDVEIDGAKGALIHVCGGNDMTLTEANSIAKKICEKMAVNDSMVIWGARVSEEFNGFIRIMLLITGIKSPQVFGKERPSSELIQFPGKKSEKLSLSDEIFDINEISYE
ncbi:MAG: hypothetical protein ACTSYC_05665, partial [Promethearchaeota archaeon]